MPSPLPVVAIALAFVAASTPSSRRQPPSPVVGTWEIELAVGEAMKGNEHVPIMGSATLVISPEADSLRGSMNGALRPNGTRSAPQQLAGRAVNGVAVLRSNGRAMAIVDGVPSEVDVVFTWTLRATEREISGTMQRRIEGALADSPPMPVKGKRSPSPAG